MNRLLMLTCLLATAGAAGCGSTHTRAYAAKSPVLKMETFFDGHVIGHGMIQNRSGEVTQRFVVDMRGRFEGDKGTLDEEFVYDDGRKQTRHWKLNRTGEHTFTGTADDVHGVARGEQYGNAIHLLYVLEVPVGDKTWKIDFDDWLFAIDEKVVLNRNKFSKLGVSVGSLTATFVRQDPETDSSRVAPDRVGANP